MTDRKELGRRLASVVAKLQQQNRMDLVEIVGDGWEALLKGVSVWGFTLPEWEKYVASGAGAINRASTYSDEEVEAVARALEAERDAMLAELGLPSDVGQRLARAALAALHPERAVHD